MRRWPRHKRLILLLGALVVVAAAAYWQLTRPAALLEHLDAALRPAGLVVASVDELSFSPWAGLSARNLVIRPRRDNDRSPEEPPLLRVEYADLAVSWTHLISGRVTAEQLRLIHPTLTIILDEAEPQSADAPSTAFGDPPTDESSASSPSHAALAKFSRLPALRIEGCDVQVHSRVAGSLRLLRRWRLDCDGTPPPPDTADRAPYTLRLTQLAGSSTRAAETSRDPLAEVTLLGSKIEARSSWIDLDTFAAIAPRGVAAILADARARGVCRVQELTFDGSRLQRLDLQLRSFGLDVPLEEPDQNVLADNRYAQLRDATGRVTFTGADHLGPADLLEGELDVRIDGELSGARVRASTHLGRFAYGLTRTADGPTGRPEYSLRAHSYRLSLDAQSLMLPDLRRHAPLLASHRVPGALRAFMKDYQATGRVNLRAELEASGDPFGEDTDDVRFSGVAEVLGGSCRYFRFPYLMSDIWGNICFDNDGITIEQLIAHHGSGTVIATGWLTNSDDWTGFNLQFQAENIALDQRLYDAVPPSYRGLWDNANPIGLADLTVRLQRPHGSEEFGSADADVQIAARLSSGSVALSPDARVKQIDGWVDIVDGVVIRDLRGFESGAQVRVSGTLRPPQPDGESRNVMHFESFDMPIRRAASANDDGGDKTLSDVSLDAIADVWGQVRGRLGGSDDHYAVRMRDGTVSVYDPADPWHRVSGWLVDDGSRRMLRQFEAQRGEARMRVEGVLPRPGSGDFAPDVTLVATDPQVERLLRQIIPPEYAAMRDALGLAGPGELNTRTRAAPDGSAVIESQISAARMESSKLPLPLRNARLKFTADDARFAVREFVADYGENGTINGGAEGSTCADATSVEARMFASNVLIDPALVQAMPPGLRSLIETLELRGSVDIELTHATIASDDVSPARFEGKITIRDGSANIGLPLTNFDGVIEGVFEVDPARGAFVSATFDLHQGALDGRRVTGLTGLFRRDYGQSLLRIDQLAGGFCDGMIDGAADFDVNTRAYHLTLKFSDACFNSFRGTDPEAPGPMRRGRMDGDLFLTGIGSDPAKRIGGGKIRIRGTSLLNTPVTARVLEESKRGARALREEVEQAELRFTWDGQVIQFSRVEIISRDSRLVGRGKWNDRDDTIDMVLLSAPLETAPRLPGISDLVDAAGKELIQYHVDGKASKPRVRVEPLHNLTEPIRALIRGT